MKRVLGAFRLGPSFQYYDNVDGEAVDIRDEARLMTYLRQRWVLQDDFKVDVATIGVYERFPNPTFSFIRISVQGTYAGNAKFVCDGGLFSAVVTSSVASARIECPETPAAAGLPKNTNTASFSRTWWASADGRIWASKPERFYAGKDGNKVLWERPATQLEVTGHPLGATGPDLAASIPRGYESLDYQASGVAFAVAGCWEIVARAGTSELRIVTEVYPESYLRPPVLCRDLKSVTEGSEWVGLVDVRSAVPDRSGFVRQQVTIVRVWKGTGSPGHAAEILQDALLEQVLERGKRYVVFAASRAYGQPELRGPWRLPCAERTLAEVRGEELVAAPRYGAEGSLTAGKTLKDLEDEVTRLVRR